MAIGGGGSGGGGGVKKETKPAAKDTLLRADPSRESSGPKHLGRNGADRRDAGLKIWKSELAPPGLMLSLSPQETYPRLGARPPLESNGGMVLGNNEASHARTADGSRGFAKDHCFSSKKPPVYQADRSEAFIEVKESEAVQALKRVKYTGINPTTESSHSKEFYSNNNQEDDSKFKSTPPPDWLKSRKRLSISMNSSRTIKTLSFSRPANLTQQTEANESLSKQDPSATSANSTKKSGPNASSCKPVPGSLSVKLIPLKKKESVPALENNNKKTKWEDNTGGAGVWEAGESSSRAQGCYRNSSSHCLNHSIFLCPCERSQYDKKVTVIAQGSIARNICIPGSTIETDMMTREACKIIQGIVRSITRSHANQMCFCGRFSLENFLCNKDGDVKMDGVHPVPLTIQGGKQDKKRAAAVIREQFFLDRVIPLGIERLLLLLESEETQNEELIEDHSSVQPPLKKMALCEFMFRNMTSIKGNDRRKYWAIIGEVKLKFDCRGGWKVPVKLNTHLNKVLEYINPKTNQPTHYEETVEGLLHYTYNAIKHLTDNAYEAGILQYLDDEINNIISGTLPGIIEAFQEAMFHNKRLFKLD